MRIFLACLTLILSLQLNAQIVTTTPGVAGVGGSGTDTTLLGYTTNRGGFMMLLTNSDFARYAGVGPTITGEGQNSGHLITLSYEPTTNPTSGQFFLPLQVGDEIIIGPGTYNDQYTIAQIVSATSFRTVEGHARSYSADTNAWAIYRNNVTVKEVNGLAAGAVGADGSYVWVGNALTGNSAGAIWAHSGGVYNWSARLGNDGTWGVQDEVNLTWGMPFQIWPGTQARYNSITIMPTGPVWFFRGFTNQEHSVFRGAAAFLNQLNVKPGGSDTSSNAAVGGVMFATTSVFTNHSTIGHVTNLANFTLPAHTLTNNLDAIRVRASGVWLPGTNHLQWRYGSVTNVCDTGSVTNNQLNTWEGEMTLLRTGNTSQRVNAWFRWNAAGGVPFSITNSLTRAIAETNGIANLIAVLSSAGLRAGQISNDLFTVEYIPASR